jgi:WD40 repeat protein
VAFGGDHVVVAGRGGLVDVLDPRSITDTPESFDTGYDLVKAVSASEDGSVVAAGLAGGHLVIYDRASGELRPIEHAHSGDVDSVDVRPDGVQIATGSPDGSAKVWDRSGQPLSTRIGHLKGVKGVALGPVGEPMATAGDDHTVRLWRPVGGRELEDLPAMGAPVQDVSYSPDGHLVAAAAAGGTKAAVWNVDTAELVQAMDADTTKVFAVAFSPDGSVLATGGAEGVIRLWDPQTGALLGQLEGHERAVWSLAFATEGDLLISGSGDGTIRRWDWKTKQPVGDPLRVGKSRVEAVDIAPDGSLLAGATNDGQVVVFDAATGDALHHLDPHEESTTALTISADGRWLATGGDGNAIEVWDLRSGHRLEHLDGHTDSIAALAFNADGSRLGSGSDDHSVELWDTAGWKKVNEFVADGRTVRSLDFSPDGSRLVTGGGEGVVRIWPTTTLDAAAICDQVAAAMSAGDLRAALGGNLHPEACTRLPT